MLQIFAMIISTVGIFATLRILKQFSESHDKGTAQFRVWQSLHLTLAAMVTAWFAVKIYCIAFIRLLVGNAKPLLFTTVFGVVAVPTALYQQGAYGLEELEYVWQIQREAALVFRLLGQATPKLVYDHGTGRLGNGISASNATLNRTMRARG